MNEKTLKILKIIAAYLIGAWAIIWFGANKITASIVFVLIIHVIVLPFSKKKWVTVARTCFVVVAFSMIIYNISTTDLPPGTDLTGIKLIDQVIHIFNGFIRHVAQ